MGHRRFQQFDILKLFDVFAFNSNGSPFSGASTGQPTNGSFDAVLPKPGSNDFGTVQFNNSNASIFIRFTPKDNVRLAVEKSEYTSLPTNTDGVNEFNIKTFDLDGNVIKSITDSVGGSVPIESDFGINDIEISKLELTFNTFFDSSFVVMNRFKLFGRDVTERFNFQFNDSLLSSKAWNSSRYDGKQLQASKINLATTNDIGNNNKTPIIQKYSRNLYIGNGIIGLDRNNPEDDDLLQFGEDFCYLQTNEYITINDDDTITFNRLEEVNEDLLYKKSGFYRAFYEDFKIGEEAKVILGDKSAKDRLKSSYPIFFNGGQLQSCFVFRPNTNLFANSSNMGGYDPDGNQEFSFVGPDLGHTLFFENETIIRQFYTGSIAGKGVQGEDANTILNKAFEFKANSIYKGDKRFFLTFASGSLGTVSAGPIFHHNLGIIRTNETGSVPDGGPILDTKNLAELSTIEIITQKSTISSTTRLVGSSKFSGNQVYKSMDPSPTPTLTPPAFASGSVIISKAEDATPSLLVELNKVIELPNGIGDKPFVIIPNNLHPHIKDNIIFYLTKAGINFGDDTSQVIEEQTKNKPKERPSLSAAEVIARRLAFEAERERNMLPREERRQRRQERREERRENRQERREERRENRQERRRERRRNRRRRR
jgi:hypothetical protein